MELIQQWLLGVVACAMLVSAAWQLCPEGAARQVARFAGGLLILCALLRPLAAWEPPKTLWDAAGYREAVARSEAELSREAEDAFSTGIARQLEAYIEDKAAALGVPLRAEVTVDSRGVPQGVTLYSACHEALAETIERELGVAKEKQVWIEP
ncbi:MAG: stage III sporulation protein AF [Oscillospiraceae bacterium]|nr:stage III sporulation protein AF [Oscillospiraceae bacterium]